MRRPECMTSSRRQVNTRRSTPPRATSPEPPARAGRAGAVPWAPVFRVGAACLAGSHPESLSRREPIGSSHPVLNEESPANAEVSDMGAGGPGDRRLSRHPWRITGTPLWGTREHARSFTGTGVSSVCPGRPRVVLSWRLAGAAQGDRVPANAGVRYLGSRARPPGRSGRSLSRPAQSVPTRSAARTATTVPNADPAGAHPRHPVCGAVQVHHTEQILHQPQAASIAAPPGVARAARGES